jgi:putative N-acetyltransferase (TIGR04045 family)
MIADSFGPFAACHFRLKYATEPWEQRGASALRRSVFCDEQGIFEVSDRDAIDDIAIHLVALSTVAVMTDEVVGTVRIHESEPGIWYGSRLAVDRRYRRVGALGAALVKLAVSSAHSLGCMRFYAHVQAQNELMFRRLAWHRLSDVELHGAPHVFMQADLAAYPPLANAPDGFHALATKAAA